MGKIKFMKSLTVVGVLAGTTMGLVACNSNSANSTTSQTKVDKSKPLTLTIFDKNTGQPFTDSVAKEITKLTGVQLKVEQPTGDPDQKLSLMLASGDLPDIILMGQGSPNLPKFEASGNLVPLNDLIDKYGPDIKKQYGNVLNLTKYTDGKNYYFPNWYGMYKDPVLGFQVRKDLMKQLPGVTESQLAGTEPLTASQFEQLLINFKKQFPTINGKPSIPLTLDGAGNGGNLGSTLSTFKGMFGMKEYYEDNGKLKYDVEDPRYLTMLEYMNKLYTEGLVDQEWATVNTQMWNEKLANGAAFATVGAYWDVNSANTTLSSGDTASEKQFYAYKVVAPGVKPSETTYGGRSRKGWDAIAITKNNKNPEATVKFLNFLASPQGQYLEQWGIEGKDWTMENGKHTPKQSVVDGLTKDTNFSNKTGIRKWLYMIKNGYGTDGTAYDLGGEQIASPVTKHARQALSDSVWDTSNYDNLGPDGGTIEALQQQKVQDVENQMISQIINASGKDEADKLYKQMISKMKEAGLDKQDQIITENYKKRMSQLK